MIKKMKKTLKKAVSTFAFEIFYGIIKWILVFYYTL